MDGERSDSCKIYPNVHIGENGRIGDFVIIGEPPRGKAAGEISTFIGDNAIIRSHTVIYAGSEIGDHFETGHNVMIRESNRIGDHVSVGTHSVIEHHSMIEDRVRIHSQAFIPEYSVLEEGCWIGPNVVFINTLYPLSLGVKENLKGPTIRRNAKIGANATVLAAVVVGEDALVGAGAVVTKDVPPGKVVVGNPAQIIKEIDELGCYHDRGNPTLVYHQEDE